MITGLVHVSDNLKGLQVHKRAGVDHDFVPAGGTSAAPSRRHRALRVSSRQCAVHALAAEGSSLYVRYEEEVTAKACRCWLDRAITPKSQMSCPVVLDPLESLWLLPAAANSCPLCW